MKTTIQLGLSDIFAALVHTGAEEGERALVAFTRSSQLVRLSFGEAFMEDAVRKWLGETQGFLVVGAVKWEKHGLSLMVESSGVPVKQAAAPNVPATAPTPAPAEPKIDPKEEWALVVTLPADSALVGKGESEMKRQAMNMARREMHDDLPPHLKKIMEAANVEAGLPPDHVGELPTDRSYVNYPGPVGRPVVLKPEDVD